MSRSPNRRAAGSPAPQPPGATRRIDLSGLNYVDAQGQDFGRRTQHRRNAAGAGRDRRQHRRRRAQGQFRQPRRLWRPGQRRTQHRCLHRQSRLHAAQRSDRRPRAAAAAECRRFRQARRQDAGEDRGALRRRQPARHHVGHERHGVRGVPGRRHQGPQRRADDPLADLEHAAGLAGGQGAGHRPDAAVGLVPDRQGPGHHHRSQSGRTRW